MTPEFTMEEVMVIRPTFNKLKAFASMNAVTSRNSLAADMSSPEAPVEDWTCSYNPRVSKSTSEFSTTSEFRCSVEKLEVTRVSLRQRILSQDGNEKKRQIYSFLKLFDANNRSKNVAIYLRRSFDKRSNELVIFDSSFIFKQNKANQSVSHI